MSPERSLFNKRWLSAVISWRENCHVNQTLKNGKDGWKQTKDFERVEGSMTDALLPLGHTGFFLAHSCLSSNKFWNWQTFVTTGDSGIKLCTKGNDLCLNTTFSYLGEGCSSFSWLGAPYLELIPTNNISKPVGIYSRLKTTYSSIIESILKACFAQGDFISPNYHDTFDSVWRKNGAYSFREKLLPTMLLTQVGISITLCNGEEILNF